MSAGPLRQGVAVVGLLALTPTMLLLATGRLRVDEAAIRAALTFVAIVVVGRVVAMALRYYVRLAERGGARTPERRRASDHA